MRDIGNVMLVNNTRSGKIDKFPFLSYCCMFYVPMRILQYISVQIPFLILIILEDDVTASPQ